jgi:sorting nexin-1/2
MSGITIAVTDPTISTEKFGKFISYKIASECSRSGFRPGAVTVDRRYNDFTWLHAEFTREIPGCILPALPEKQTVGRFSTEFIESRRRSLERYLQRVVSHPELSSSPLLALFLQADDSTLNRAKEEGKANKPKLATSAVNWLEGKVHMVANGKAELEKSAADVKVDEMTAYVQVLEKQLNNVSRHSDAMVKKLREASAAMLDFGQQLHFLGQSEGDSVGSGLIEVGDSLCSAATLSQEKADEELAQFVEPLEDYARMMSSVKQAITQRQEKRTAYMYALSDVDAKAAALKKVEGFSGSKEVQLRQKQVAARVAEENKELAKAEYERVTDRLLQEFEIFRARKLIDLKEIAIRFADIQVNCSRRSEEAWRELLPKLQTISTETAQSQLQEAMEQHSGGAGRNHQPPGATGRAPTAADASAAASSANPFGDDDGGNDSPYGGGLPAGGDTNFHEEDEDEYAGV